MRKPAPPYLVKLRPPYSVGDLQDSANHPSATPCSLTVSTFVLTVLTSVLTISSFILPVSTCALTIATFVLTVSSCVIPISSFVLPISTSTLTLSTFVLTKAAFVLTLATFAVTFAAFATAKAAFVLTLEAFVLTKASLVPMKATNGLRKVAFVPTNRVGWVGPARRSFSEGVRPRPTRPERRKIAVFRGDSWPGAANSPAETLSRRDYLLCAPASLRENRSRSLRAKSSGGGTENRSFRGVLRPPSVQFRRLRLGFALGPLAFALTDPAGLFVLTAVLAVL
jgi:hypothetical protein